MAQRTTIMMDDKSLEAARELATHYHVSTSEAIRRAVLAHRDQLQGHPLEVRLERKRQFQMVIDAFEGHDPQEEVRRIKDEDEGF